MNKASCFIMGMPEAGKTTFLAALWYCLTNSNKNKFKYKESNKNLNYLSNICEDWAQLKTLPRTRHGFEELDITLVLEDKYGKEIELTFPDLSGETFQSQYDKRETSLELSKYIKNTSCIILFINPMTINETIWIAEIPEKIRNNETNTNSMGNLANERVPLQVQLVELLQFVQYIRNQLPVKLELLISAWDVIENSNDRSTVKPEEYIREHLPLLWQYIKANTEIFDPLFFGVSAQGGNLNSDDKSQGNNLEDRVKLLEIEDPCERVFIIDNNGRKNADITLPLYKIVGGEYGK